MSLEQLQAIEAEQDRVKKLERELAEAKEALAVAQSRVENADVNLEQLRMIERGKQARLAAQLKEAEELNERVHSELLAEKAKVISAATQRRLEQATAKSVWTTHEQQFAEQEKKIVQLAEQNERLREALEAAPCTPLERDAYKCQYDKRPGWAWSGYYCPAHKPLALPPIGPRMVRREVLENVVSYATEVRNGDKMLLDAFEDALTAARAELERTK